MLKSTPIGRNELDKVTFSSQGDSSVTLSEVKSWLKVDSNTLDTEIYTLMDIVLDEFMRLTNMSLVAQTVTAVYSGYGSEISLPYGPINTISSVKTLYKGTKTTLTTDDYYLQGDILFMNKVVNEGLEVVYTAGNDIPDGLRGAYLQAVLTSFNDREDNAMGGVAKIPNNSRKRALRFKRY